MCDTAARGLKASVAYKLCVRSQVTRWIAPNPRQTQQIACSRMFAAARLQFFWVLDFGA
jgi:hypothetical protein